MIFYKASQGDSTIGGADGMIWSNFAERVGQCTSNRVELLALNLVLLLSLSKGIHKIQVLGDSQLVINWMKELNRSPNFFS